MGKFKNSILLPLFALALIALALVLHRALDPDRVCLSWDGLSEIRMQDQVVRSCDVSSRLERPRAQGPLREIVRRLRRLARLGWLMDGRRGLHIEIDSTAPMAFERDGAHLRLGAKLAAQPGQLERAVLLAWLETNWPTSGRLAQELTADILTWSVLGEIDAADSELGVSLRPADRLRFSLAPQSKMNYCLSPFRSVADRAACETIGGEMDRTVTMRPLIAWSVWNYVRLQPASRQIHFFQSLLSAEPAELPPEKEGAQTWAKDVVTALLTSWLPETPLNHSDLQRVFYRLELNQPVDFDLTVEVANREISDRALKSLEEWARKSPARRILFVSGHRRVILPENINVDLAGDSIRSKAYVLLACEWPKMKDVLALKSRLFYALRVCGDETLPVWRDVLAGQGTPTWSFRNASYDASM